MWTNVLIAAVGLAGALTLLWVLKSVIETVVFIRAAVKTGGTVIRFGTTRNSDGQTMYLPVFQYRTNDGSRFEYTSTVASNPPAYAIGETATILYLRKNPRRAKLKSFAELWLVKLVLTIIGLGCSGFAAGFFLGR